MEIKVLILQDVSRIVKNVIITKRMEFLLVIKMFIDTIT